MNNEQRLQQLERQVQELLAWKEQKTRQQISYPLDQTSKDILNKEYMRITSILTYYAGAGGTAFSTFIGEQGGYRFEISPIITTLYTVNATTNYLTIISGTLKYQDGQTVTLFTDGTAPSPLSAGIGTVYYVRDSDGTTFKLAATAGGAAIDITDTGTGTQFIAYS